MEILLRLSWALPLVLLIGLGMALLVKRLLLPQQEQTRQRMVARQALVLSEHTSLHLIEIDGCAYLIAESARHTDIQSIATPHRDARLLRYLRGAAPR